MTYQAHWLLAWGGTLAVGEEVWSNSLRIKGTNPGGQVWTDAIVNDVLNGYVLDIKAMHSGASAQISSACRLEWVKFNPIGPDGRYASTTKTYAKYFTGSEMVQGAGTAGVPTFASCAVTLKTAIQRGPGSSGRFYIPQCTMPVDATTGRFSASNTTDMANFFASFIANLGNMEGFDYNSLVPHVISDVGVPGPANPVTLVQIGNVPDTQRRRKNNLREIRSSAVVPVL
jgi:hypothetical protein